jgi:alanyl-tRNA synthetase
VEEVIVDESEGQVIHYVSAESDYERLRDSQIHGRVDWSRRFDHMQQHTGQHILSQAFERIAGVATVGFHMGAESSTLDLDANRLTVEHVDAAEDLANNIVWEDRDVSIQSVDAAAAEQLPLRKIPPARNGLLRLVSVEGFDLSACGGTHVRRSGEIGLVKIVKLERVGGKSRVEFLCGKRALVDYRRKHLVLARLSGEMTTGYWELENSVARLRDDLKQANRALKAKTEALLTVEAQALAKDATNYLGTHLICHHFNNREPGELRNLASRLTGNERTVVLFGLAGDKSQMLFARSNDVEIAMNEVLTNILPLLGNATGGGSPKFAQGGGPQVKDSQLVQVLAAAEDLVQDMLVQR